MNPDWQEKILEDKKKIRKEFRAEYQIHAIPAVLKKNQTRIKRKLLLYLKHFSKNNRIKVMAYAPFETEVPVNLMLSCNWIDLYFPLIKGNNLKAKSVTNGVILEINKMDKIIVPGLYVNSQGYRLGRGRAYYDRALCYFPKSDSIFVGYSWQIKENIPVEKHDKRVGYIISELFSLSTS
jgi:5-formyltetrahydrofolate cyclo-ligase